MTLYGWCIFFIRAVFRTSEEARVPIDFADKITTRLALGGRREFFVARLVGKLLGFSIWRLTDEQLRPFTNRISETGLG